LLGALPLFPRWFYSLHVARTAFLRLRTVAPHPFYRSGCVYRVTFVRCVWFTILLRIVYRYVPTLPVCLRLLLRFVTVTLPLLGSLRILGCVCLICLYVTHLRWLRLPRTCLRSHVYGCTVWTFYDCVVAVCRCWFTFTFAYVTFGCVLLVYVVCCSLILRWLRTFARYLYRCVPAHVTPRCTLTRLRLLICRLLFYVYHVALPCVVCYDYVCYVTLFPTPHHGTFAFTDALISLFYFCRCYAHHVCSTFRFILDWFTLLLLPHPLRTRLFCHGFSAPRTHRTGCCSSSYALAFVLHISIDTRVWFSLLNSCPLIWLRCSRRVVHVTLRYATTRLYVTFPLFVLPRSTPVCSSPWLRFVLRTISRLFRSAVCSLVYGTHHVCYVCSYWFYITTLFTFPHACTRLRYADFTFTAFRLPLLPLHVCCLYGFTFPNCVPAYRVDFTICAFAARLLFTRCCRDWFCSCCCVVEHHTLRYRRFGYVAVAARLLQFDLRGYVTVARSLRCRLRCCVLPHFTHATHRCRCSCTAVTAPRGYVDWLPHVLRTVATFALHHGYAPRDLRLHFGLRTLRCCTGLVARRSVLLRSAFTVAATRSIATHGLRWFTLRSRWTVSTHRTFTFFTVRLRSCVYVVVHIAVTLPSRTLPRLRAAAIYLRLPFYTRLRSCTLFFTFGGFHCVYRWIDYALRALLHVVTHYVVFCSYRLRLFCRFVDTPGCICCWFLTVRCYALRLFVWVRYVTDLITLPRLRLRCCYVAFRTFTLPHARWICWHTAHRFRLRFVCVARLRYAVTVPGCCTCWFVAVGYTLIALFDFLTFAITVVDTVVYVPRFRCYTPLPLPLIVTVTLRSLFGLLLRCDFVTLHRCYCCCLRYRCVTLLPICSLFVPLLTVHTPHTIVTCVHTHHVTHTLPRLRVAVAHIDLRSPRVYTIHVTHAFCRTRTRLHPLPLRVWILPLLIAPFTILPRCYVLRSRLPLVGVVTTDRCLHCRLFTLLICCSLLLLRLLIRFVYVGSGWLPFICVLITFTVSAYIAVLLFTAAYYHTAHTHVPRLRSFPLFDPLHYTLQLHFVYHTFGLRSFTHAAVYTALRLLPHTRFTATGFYGWLLRLNTPHRLYRLARCRLLPVTLYHYRSVGLLPRYVTTLVAGLIVCTFLLDLPHAAAGCLPLYTPVACRLLPRSRCCFTLRCTFHRLPFTVCTITVRCPRFAVTDFVVRYVAFGFARLFVTTHAGLRLFRRLRLPRAFTGCLPLRALRCYVTLRCYVRYTLITLICYRYVSCCLPFDFTATRPHRLRCHTLYAHVWLISHCPPYVAFTVWTLLRFRCVTHHVLPYVWLHAIAVLVTAFTWRFTLWFYVWFWFWSHVLPFVALPFTLFYTFVVVRLRLFTFICCYVYAALLRLLRVTCTLRCLILRWFPCSSPFVYWFCIRLHPGYHTDCRDTFTVRCIPRTLPVRFVRSRITRCYVLFGWICLLRTLLHDLRSRWLIVCYVYVDLIVTVYGCYVYTFTTLHTRVTFVDFTRLRLFTFCAHAVVPFAFTVYRCRTRTVGLDYVTHAYCCAFTLPFVVLRYHHCRVHAIVHVCTAHRTTLYRARCPFTVAGCVTFVTGLPCARYALLPHCCYVRSALVLLLIYLTCPFARYVVVPPVLRYVLDRLHCCLRYVYVVRWIAVLLPAFTLSVNYPFICTRYCVYVGIRCTLRSRYVGLRCCLRLHILRLQSRVYRLRTWFVAVTRLPRGLRTAPILVAAVSGCVALRFRSVLPAFYAFTVCDWLFTFTHCVAFVDLFVALPLPDCVYVYVGYLRVVVCPLLIDVVRCLFTRLNILGDVVCCYVTVVVYALPTFCYERYLCVRYGDQWSILLILRCSLNTHVDSHLLFVAHLLLRCCCLLLRCFTLFLLLLLLLLLRYLLCDLRCTLLLRCLLTWRCWLFVVTRYRLAVALPTICHVYVWLPVYAFTYTHCVGFTVWLYLYVAFPVYVYVYLFTFDVVVCYVALLRYLRLFTFIYVCGDALRSHDSTLRLFTDCRYICSPLICGCLTRLPVCRLPVCCCCYVADLPRTYVAVGLFVIPVVILLLFTLRCVCWFYPLRCCYVVDVAFVTFICLVALLCLLFEFVCSERLLPRWIRLPFPVVPVWFRSRMPHVCCCCSRYVGALRWCRSLRLRWFRFPLLRVVYVLLPLRCYVILLPLFRLIPRFGVVPLTRSDYPVCVTDFVLVTVYGCDFLTERLLLRLPVVWLRYCSTVAGSCRCLRCAAVVVPGSLRCCVLLPRTDVTRTRTFGCCLVCCCAFCLFGYVWFRFDLRFSTLRCRCCLFVVCVCFTRLPVAFTILYRCVVVLCARYPLRLLLIALFLFRYVVVVCRCLRLLFVTDLPVVTLRCCYVVVVRWLLRCSLPVVVVARYVCSFVLRCHVAFALPFVCVVRTCGTFCLRWLFPHVCCRCLRCDYTVLGLRWICWLFTAFYVTLPYPLVWFTLLNVTRTFVDLRLPVYGPSRLRITVPLLRLRSHVLFPLPCRWFTRLFRWRYVTLLVAFCCRWLIAGCAFATLRWLFVWFLLRLRLRLLLYEFCSHTVTVHDVYLTISRCPVVALNLRLRLRLLLCVVCLRYDFVVCYVVVVVVTLIVVCVTFVVDCYVTRYRLFALLLHTLLLLLRYCCVGCCCLLRVVVVVVRYVLRYVVYALRIVALLLLLLYPLFVVIVTLLCVVPVPHCYLRYRWLRCYVVVICCCLLFQLYVVVVYCCCYCCCYCCYICCYIVAICCCYALFIHLLLLLVIAPYVYAFGYRCYRRTLYRCCLRFPFAAGYPTFTPRTRCWITPRLPLRAVVRWITTLPHAFTLLRCARLLRLPVLLRFAFGFWLCRYVRSPTFYAICVTFAVGRLCLFSFVWFGCCRTLLLLFWFTVYPLCCYVAFALPGRLRVDVTPFVTRLVTVTLLPVYVCCLFTRLFTRGWCFVVATALHTRYALSVCCCNSHWFVYYPHVPVTRSLLRLIYPFAHVLPVYVDFVPGWLPVVVIYVLYYVWLPRILLLRVRVTLRLPDCQFDSGYVYVVTHGLLPAFGFITRLLRLPVDLLHPHVCTRFTLLPAFTPLRCLRLPVTRCCTPGFCVVWFVADLLEHVVCPVVLFDLRCCVRLHVLCYIDCVVRCCRLRCCLRLRVVPFTTLRYVPVGLLRLLRCYARCCVYVTLLLPVDVTDCRLFICSRCCGTFVDLRCWFTFVCWIWTFVDCLRVRCCYFPFVSVVVRCSLFPCSVAYVCWTLFTLRCYVYTLPHTFGSLFLLVLWFVAVCCSFRYVILVVPLIVRCSCIVIPLPVLLHCYLVIIVCWFVVVVTLILLLLLLLFLFLLLLLLLLCIVIVCCWLLLLLLLLLLVLLLHSIYLFDIAICIVITFVRFVVLAIVVYLLLITFVVDWVTLFVPLLLLRVVVVDPLRLRCCYPVVTFALCCCTRRCCCTLLFCDNVTLFDLLLLLVVRCCLALIVVDYVVVRWLRCLPLFPVVVPPVIAGIYVLCGDTPVFAFPVVVVALRWFYICYAFTPLLLFLLPLLLFNLYRYVVERCRILRGAGWLLLLRCSARYVATFTVDYDRAVVVVVYCCLR